MFFEGTLTEGISSAVSQSKAVVCYIAGEEDEQNIPFTELFQEDEVIRLLRTHAVTLRLKSGSVEAGYLAAYCPIDDTPLFVVIRGGILKDVLKSDLNIGDFTERLGDALTEQPPPESTQTTAALEPAELSRTTRPESFDGPDVPSGDEHAQNENLDAVFAERGRKLEAQKKAQDARDKAERARKAKERREAAEAGTNGDPTSKRARELSYAQEQRRIKQQAAAERERIKRAIEDDKAARKEQDEVRRQLRQLQREEQAVEAQGSDSKKQTEKRPASSQECVIQVRLFDGAAIRTKFSSTCSLSKDVRPWVDQQRKDGDAPYTFKHTQHPPPHRAIDVSEEDQSLANLGLSPSATLVLVEVKGYTSAYAGGGGIVSGGINLGYGIVSSGLGLVGSAVGMVLGSGTNGTPTAGAESGSPEKAESVSRDQESTKPSTNIRTLRDAESAKDDKQFYNGNQLNFEPRKDD